MKMKKGKRVFMLIDSLVAGGAQRQFVYLAKELKNAGCEVLCFTYWPDLNFYQPFLEEAGVELIASREANKSSKRIYCVIKAIKKFKPDCVISFLDTPSIIACIARCFCKFKLVVSERNTTQQLTRRGRLKYALFRLADSIVPNSHSQGRFIANNYPNLKEKVSVITNTIDTLRFVPAKEKAENAVQRVISVGRCAPQKNYLTMVDAVKILHDKGVKAHFDWFANTTDELGYPEAVRAKIQELKLEDLIDIHKPDSKIERQYQSSDVFWLASIYEGFPNVLCEAMACGLPVVCSNVCDNPDIVEDGVNGFLTEANSPEQMADRLEQALSMGNGQKTRMSTANVCRIKELCSEEVFVKKYMDLIG
uniref:glycosyltransferase n=1 Tax=Candidatus Limisoma sp. TaxID=3076476 RepID=UPI004028E085